MDKLETIGVIQYDSITHQTVRASEQVVVFHTLGCSIHILQEKVPELISLLNKAHQLSVSRRGQ